MNTNKSEDASNFKKKKLQLVLASQSPRRQKVLKDNGYDFIVDVSHADEESIRPGNIKDKVLQTAKLKAETVAKRHDDSIIIGADTLVYFEGEEIGQQKDREKAKKILKKLLGKTHEVYTGLCIIVKEHGKIKKMIQDTVITKVTLKDVNENTLNGYIDTEQYKGKAGAYSLDDAEFKPFIDKIDGSYTNVMGLPIEKFKTILKKVQED